MIQRSLLVAVAAIGLACSSAHQIGTETPPESGSTMTTSGAGGSGSVATGQGGSGVGTSSTSGSSASSSTSGSASSTGGSTGSGSSTGGGTGAGGAVSDGGDASSAPSADAGDDRKIVSGDAGQFPPRIVFFYTPLGTVLSSWRPIAAGGGFSLSPILQPLAPFKDRVLVVDGIDSLLHPGVLTSTDESGPSLLLTGAGSSDPRVPGGASLGHYLGQKWMPVQFGAIQLGVQSNVAIDFEGPSLPDVPINDPAQAASRILAGHPQSGVQFSSTNDFNLAGRQMMDLVRLSIQYDLTRVISLSWGDVNGTTMFNWIAGVDKDYRTLAMNSGVAGADRDHFIAVQTWYAQQFAYLVNALATTPEGNGSLLDHTLVLWVSETGEASARTGKNIPVVMAGNLLGRFRTGAYVQTTGSQLNLLSTIAQVAGITMPIGDATLGNTPINALLQP